MSELEKRLVAVRERIAEAASLADREKAELTTIVVTKFHPVSLIRELWDLGVRDFGENRHQEASTKAEELSDLNLNWHFVGQLQRRKARQVRKYVSMIHSIDRDAVVRALVSGEGRVDCFIQYNLTDDPARGGIDDSGLELLVENVCEAEGLRLCGVMAVAPLDEEPRAAFARLRGISERVRSLAPDATAISAGMSHDYAEAIAEGATHLRIGSAITGNRPEPG